MDDTRFEQVWSQLEMAIKEIQQKCKTNDMSYVDLYRHAYDLVINRRSNRMYSNLKVVITEHLKTHVVTNILNSMNNDFLSVMDKEWTDHQLSMTMIRDILMYLDRIYVQQLDLDNIYNLGIGLFRDNVARFPAIKEKLRTILLQAVARERAGEAVDRLKMKNACNMLVGLGINNLGVYVDDFEVSLLGETEEYYRMKRQKLLQENSASAYLKMASKWVEEETERAKHFLHESTEPKMTARINDLLIKSQMRQIVEMGNGEVRQMIMNNKVDELSLLYKLFKKQEGGEEIVYECFSKCVNFEGSNIYQEEELEGKSTTAYTNIALNLMKNLLDLKDRYESFVKSVFQNNLLYSDKIEIEFKNLMRDKQNTPEYMSLYMDSILKKGDKSFTDDEIERKMDRIIGLFKCMVSVDKFEEYYRRHMIKRLLYDKSIGEDYEKNMVLKIKLQCVWNFTLNMESLFSDIHISEDLHRDFKEYQSNINASSKLDLQVKVLKGANWPFPPNSTNFVMPPVVSKAFEDYLIFYLNRHAKRKLLLNPSFGVAEMKMLFYDNGRSRPTRTQILNVPTFSMFALLLFNDHSSLTFEVIHKATNLPEGHLKKNLAMFLWGKNKVLVKVPDSPGKREILPTDVFSINEAYTSKLRKVTIQLAEGNRETKEQRAETSEIIKKRRRFEIEACIVRVMKARKTMKHNDLIVEVTNLLKARFLPEPSMIKSGIELMIEKDYMARQPDSIDTYNYIS